MKDFFKKYAGGIIGVGILPIIFIIQGLFPGTSIANTLAIMSGIIPAVFILMPISYNTAVNMCQTEKTCIHADSQACLEYVNSPVSWCLSLVEGFFGVFLLVFFVTVYFFIGQKIYKIVKAMKK